MVQGNLKVFDTKGTLVAQAPHEVADELTAEALDALVTQHIGPREGHSAVLQSTRGVHGVWVAERSVPRAAVRTSQRRRAPGRWLTSFVRLGDWGGIKAFVGPELFVRQVDMRASESGLTPLLFRFVDEVPAVSFDVAGERVDAFRHHGQQFFYCSRNGLVWKLLGAGDTPADRFGVDFAAQPPAALDELTYRYGAIELP